MIKAIIFDLGGVVIKHRSDVMPYMIGNVFRVDEKRARDIWHEYKDALLTGELPSLEFLEKVKTELLVSIPTQELLKSWRVLYEREAGELNAPLLTAIGKLRKSYTVYLLTDTIEVHHEFNNARGLYRHFDDAFCSHIEKKSKSQGATVFEHFLNKFNLRAQTCVFIDDLENYVTIAESVGIHGILYTTNNKLFHDLKRVGVKINNGLTNKT